MNEQEPVAFHATKLVSKETLRIVQPDGRLIRFDVSKDTTVTDEPLQYVDPTIIEQCVAKEEAKLVDETLFVSRYRKVGRIAGLGIGIMSALGDASLDQLPLRIGVGTLVGSVVYVAIGECLSHADLWTKIQPQNKETRKHIALLKSVPTAPEVQE